MRSMELTIGLLSFQLHFLKIPGGQGASLGAGRGRRAGSRGVLMHVVKNNCFIFAGSVQTPPDALIRGAGPEGRARGRHPLPSSEVRQVGLRLLAAYPALAQDRRGQESSHLHPFPWPPQAHGGLGLSHGAGERHCQGPGGSPGLGAQGPENRVTQQ